MQRIIAQQLKKAKRRNHMMREYDYAIVTARVSLFAAESVSNV